jgi:hypothetical protein
MREVWGTFWQTAARLTKKVEEGRTRLESYREWLGARDANHISLGTFPVVGLLLGSINFLP